MNNATMAIVGDEAAVTPAKVGWTFIRWGLGLFITGFAVGFIPILHYMVGAQQGDVGPVFLKNVTLWWGCPAVLAEMTLKTGSLGMIAIGLCYLAAIRQDSAHSVCGLERFAAKLCAYGLIAELVTAGVGFYVGNKIWPNFYFEPVQTGKNLWLAAQGLSILVYFVGICYAVAGVRRAAAQR
ncbi:hypothetical protein [Pseudomonas arsenicoxydans]|uniref:Uncharacterized protein n=1 Tax=Pseudomonas arsenicoxydans TaxID=702115 RepID=A0A502HPB5_9PSED|nr:hypothetical protein [Pseudomonas arsenicoxydans]TPG75226.1 hypothetical protein EAH78_20410 [Pseudomonas arsenicoxydans]